MARGAGRKNRTGAFGSVDKLATGYRARYYGPDGRRYKAPTLFLTKQDARGWLSIVHADIIKDAWARRFPDVRPGTARIRRLASLRPHPR
jgi:hypothetical protein